MNYMSNSFIIPHFSGDIRKNSTRNLNIAPPSERWVCFWVAEEPLGITFVCYGDASPKPPFVRFDNVGTRECEVWVPFSE